MLAMPGGLMRMDEVLPRGFGPWNVREVTGEDPENGGSNEH